MKKIIGIFILIIAAWARCGATQYYVSSSSGNDSTGNGTQVNPWKTFGGTGNHVNAGAFVAGDTIYLKRGDVWNEPLIPPSSGTSGNPITFDAYGTGPAPVITAASAIPFAGASWTYVSGSTWKATIPTTLGSGTVNLVQFGNLYGRKQPYGSGCASSIANKYDWCLVWPSLYAYSPAGTNPVSTYATDGSIVPIIAQASGLAMISVASKSWLVFQHIKVQAFDYMGVSVTGNSDNLVFANIEVDGMAPAAGTPLGFYVNVTGGSSIQFLNDENLFGGKTGVQKKDAAMSFLESALQTIDAVAAREIVDPAKFKDGISKIVDGTVECLNASTWAKSGGQSAGASGQ